MNVTTRFINAEGTAA